MYSLRMPQCHRMADVESYDVIYTSLFSWFRRLFLRTDRLHSSRIEDYTDAKAVTKKTKLQFNSTSPNILPPRHTRRWSKQDVSAFMTVAFAVIGLFLIVCLSLRETRFTQTNPSPDTNNTDIPTQTSLSPTQQEDNKDHLVHPAARTPQEYSSTTQDGPMKLLRFDDEAAKQAFLATNGLPLDKLHYISTLALYTTNLVSPSLPTGSTLLENQSYHSLLTPTDPMYPSQWYLPASSLDSAWNTQSGDASIITAVIDTGVAIDHEDLASKWSNNQNETGVSISEGPAPNCSSQSLPLSKSCNNIDDDGDGYIDNYLGWSFVNNNNNVQTGRTIATGSGVSHGTMVAGIIGASSNNNKGGSGSSWGTKVLPIQALDDTGSGTTLSVSQAIRYAVDHGAKVINLSLGSESSDVVMQEQVQYAISQGVSIVAAAGNDGCDCVLYPARYTGVISVGASTNLNTRASFSSYGSALSLVAPGVDICSTAWSQSNNSSLYACGSGTSFAAPVASSVVSLMLSQDSTLTPTQIKSALVSSAIKTSAMAGASRTDQYGAGLLDARAALISISSPPPVGVAINTHAISLLATDTSKLHDNLNSTCTPAPNRSCRLRAINLATNQVIALGQADAGMPLNLYWTARTSLLSEGRWLIQLYTQTDTAQSQKQEDILTISP